jgi:hypothetical protein
MRVVLAEDLRNASRDGQPSVRPRPEKGVAMKRTAIAFLILSLVAATSAFAGTVKISQVYGGGGNSGSLFSNDFVELFNTSNVAVDISGWSLQYGSATGTVNLGACTNCLTVLPSGSTIAPCGYFLVQLAAGATPSNPLPTPDYAAPAATANNLSASAGKIGLKADALTTPCTGTFEDLIGYGTANCFETAAAGGLSNTTAVLRNNGGLDDTDNNSADCTVAAPAPRNSSSPPNPNCLPNATEEKTWGRVKGLYH